MALFTDDIAPADAVALALNVEPSVFAGNVLREHLQAALRCRIGTDCLAVQLAQHRTDADDLAAAFL